ncbi:tetratricopeptide repeat protein [Streptomyces sp. NPDC059909]|uniref:tetratricopeptide repeat protein n=1 Tax=Streptomyces sp. NPDC059909 TaxID=3346998 RepID=UPI00365935FD
MDAAELDRRALTYDGWIPPDLVSWLLEHGHHDEVQLQARGGDWSCAQAWAPFLAEQDRRNEALEVLSPYAETGWWKAARSVAELLETWGRTDEAIGLVRPYAEREERPALKYCALLLARHGRADEAYSLLRPHIEDWLLADALVEVTAGSGRDEEVATLLAVRIEAGRPCGGPPCGSRTPEPWNAVGLLATIRERQGRIDEAIALLRTRDVTSVNGRDQLAELLARHDRIGELREYAAIEVLGDAARCLAESLEERGDLAGAIEVYRPRVADGSPHAAVELAQLLARHGRGREAIEVLSSLPCSSGGWEDWVVDALCTLYIDRDRAEDGLAYLDHLSAQSSPVELEFVLRLRTRLLVSCGRTEQAIEEARTHLDAHTWPAAQNLARLLADAGRPEEAVAVLDPAIAANRRVLAAQLMELGRVKDAVAVLHRPKRVEALPWSNPPWSSACPPF